MSLIQKFIKLDKFGTQAASLNFKGEELLRTLPGAIMTIVIQLLALYVVIQTSIKMFNYEDPKISNYSIKLPTEQLNDVVINMPEQEIDLAFGFNTDADFNLKIPDIDLLSI